MNRNIASWIAVLALVGLTLVTWQLADHGASPWALAGVAFVKVVIIGAVFLELFRAWPVWSVLFAGSIAVVVAGSAALISG